MQDTGNPSHSASHAGNSSVNAFEPDRGGSKRLLLGIGLIVLVGIVLTVIVVRNSIPGWPLSSSPRPPVELVSLVDSGEDPASAVPVAPAPEVPKTPPARNRVVGPVAVVAVPSAGLRSAPSLSARPLKTVVKHNDQVRVLKRQRSLSGPDWIQIQTSSGHTGWVWASVIRQAKGKRPA